MPGPRSRGAGARAVWLVVLLLACGPSSEVRVYSVRGVVRDVQPELGQVVVAHEEIPGLMPAMTMNFDVADAGLLERLAPDQVIEFELEVTPKRYRILAARVRGEAFGGPEAPRLAGVVVEREPAPAFQLLDQDGRPLALAHQAGKAVLLDFVYTRCPGPCPILTGLLLDVQRQLPDAIRPRIHFLSVSLDPAHDTPAVLRDWAQARGLDLARWSLLTGSVPEVEAVLKEYGVGSVRQPDGEIDHLVVTFLIDGEGRIARRYVGLDHEPARIAADLVRVAGAGS